MYTRSYRSNTMPPDYSGTALVINQQPRSVPEHENRYGNERSDAPSERISRHAPASFSDDSGSSETDDRRYPRKITEYPAEYAENERGRFVAPFGENGQPNDALTQLGDEKGGLFSVGNLKNDDLLLLGLIILLMSDHPAESDTSSREALLILAVLYLSGM